MKRSMRLMAACAALMLAPMTASAQELLTNADLTSSTQIGSPILYYPEPTGWTITTDPCSFSPCPIIPYVFGQNYTPYSGHQAEFADRLRSYGGSGHQGLIVETYQGRYPGEIIGDVSSEISQTVPGVAGNKYRFSGWAHFEAGYSGGVDTLDSFAPNPDRRGQPSITQTNFALEFLDSSNAVLPGSIVWELHDQGGQQNDFRVPDGRDWMEHVLLAVAPAGTVNVRVRAAVVDGEFNVDPAPGESQNVFFDDFSLRVVPEPSSVLLALGGVAALAFARRRR